ncbi:MAG: hypothetical protein DIU70_006220 [Bacillota bacterium]
MELHLLAARQFLLGTCNLMLLPLPPGWRLVDGPAPPEVDRWLRRDGVAWAVAGRGSYRVLVAGEAGQPGQALSLEVRVEGRPREGKGGQGTPAVPGGGGPGSGGHGNGGPGASHWLRPGRGVRRPPLDQVLASGSGRLDGHPGAWALGEVGRGFPRRFRPALWVELDCPETERRLSLFAEGAEPAVLERFLAALRAGPLCHGPGGREVSGAEEGFG